jgi:nucleoside-diphosphate-sugar epimerase
MGPTLVMMRNILDVCRECSTRLIFLSGWEVYSGYQADRLIVSEATPLFPRGPYGETKYLCECLLQQYQSNYGIRCALVRSGPVFGPGGTKPRFLFTFMKQALRDEPIVTHRYLNGEPALDLLYIDDAVDILASVVTRDFVGSLNIGSGTATSTADIARMIIRQLGSKSTIHYASVGSYTANIVMNPGKAKSEFGWSPRVSVEEGIRLLCAKQIR